MEQTKEQILNGLYALRAGLSIMSQKSDEIKQIRIQQIKDLLVVGDKIKKYRAMLVEDCPDYSYDTYFREHQRDPSRWIGYLPFKNRYEFERLLNSNDLEKHITENILGEKLTNATRKPYVEFCDKYFGSFGRLIENYACVQWLKSGVYKQFLESKRNNLCKKLFKPKKTIAEIEQDIYECPSLESAIKRAEDGGNHQIKEICESMDIYYNSLINEFNSLIDFRDWSHLDLVIYYFETRRADTTKEALQLLDKELQTRRIEDLIIEATQQICNTLAVGFAMVSRTIETCCNRLMTLISQSVSTVSTQLSSLTNAVNMSNALQAKANVTSEHLMQDVLYIRRGV